MDHLKDLVDLVGVAAMYGLVGLVMLIVGFFVVMFRQLAGGALVTVELRDATREAAFRFMDALSLCVRSTSLGDVFTLVYPQPKRGGLIRVSVGCEDVEDLVEDFTRGLSFVA